jgi:catechol 2,3-dioxygenase-like lactoylglutathione lyase family enzyme
MSFHPAIPTLRILDEAKAREFYIDWLGFEVEFEARPEPGAPLYMGIRKGDCCLRLSEHHGDGIPGTHVLVECDELEAFHASLAPYKYYRPSLQDQEWGQREMTVQDGFGNRLVFFRRLAK